jgi:hypothetical protein
LRYPLMRSSPIEVGDIAIEHALELFLLNNQQMIQAFLFDAPQEALADRIGAFRVIRRFENLDTCAGYLADPFSKGTDFTLEFRRGDPSFPAFFPGSCSLQEEHGCLDHDGFSIRSPGAIRRVSRCVPSSPARLTVWQRGQDPCLHHAMSGVLPLQLPCL